MATDNGPKRDVSPAEYSNPDKKRGESFDEAANPPNNPKKNVVLKAYNITDEYCGDLDSDD